MNATVTETSIPLCCAMCLTVPEDPGALHNFGPDDLPYWLCIDRYACLDRAVAAQHAASQPQEDTADSASGTSPATSAPDVPPSGEGQPDVPGAGQDGPEAAQEAEALEPLPEAEDAAHGPAEDGEAEQ